MWLSHITLLPKMTSLTLATLITLISTKRLLRRKIRPLGRQLITQQRFRDSKGINTLLLRRNIHLFKVSVTLLIRSFTKMYISNVLFDVLLKLPRLHFYQLFNYSLIFEDFGKGHAVFEVQFFYFIILFILLVLMPAADDSRAKRFFLRVEFVDAVHFLKDVEFETYFLSQENKTIYQVVYYDAEAKSCATIVNE